MGIKINSNADRAEYAYGVVRNYGETATWMPERVADAKFDSAGRGMLSQWISDLIGDLHHLVVLTGIARDSADGTAQDAIAALTIRGERHYAAEEVAEDQTSRLQDAVTDLVEAGRTRSEVLRLVMDTLVKAEAI